MTGSTLRRISRLALTLPLGLIAVAWLLNPGPPPGRRMAAADDRFAANQTASGPTDPKPPAGRPDELPQVGYPGLESPHVDPLAVSGNLVFVTNTPAGTIDVLDIHTHAVIRRIAVGVDPVCIAVRPDGREIWVANHVSDSVSVIDADPQSATYLHVIATVQDLDPETRATRFDEPAGIAFAGDSKAYVALSSTNQIAVVDVATRRVTGRLN
ncbi:MAG: YncE family protein, partial [Planctomycetaceae bacterium]